MLWRIRCFQSSSDENIRLSWNLLVPVMKKFSVFQLNSSQNITCAKNIDIGICNYLNMNMNMVSTSTTNKKRKKEKDVLSSLAGRFENIPRRGTTAALLHHRNELLMVDDIQRWSPDAVKLSHTHFFVIVDQESPPEDA